MPPKKRGRCASDGVSDGAGGLYEKGEKMGDRIFWILLPAILSVAGLAVVYWDKKRTEQKNALYNEVQRLLEAEDREGAIRLCERALAAPDAPARKTFAAKMFCRLAADSADERYEQGLRFLKEEDALFFRVLYAFNAGKFGEMREACEKIRSGKKKNVFYAERMIADSLFREGEKEKAYRKFMALAEANRGRRRNSAAASALSCACGLLDLSAAKKAYALMGRKYKREYFPDLDALEGRVGVARRKGYDAAEYLSALRAALRPFERRGATILGYDPTGSPSSYFGGTLDYDHERVRSVKAHFFAQLCLSDIPVAELKKPYTLRLWLTNAEEELPEGVYPCDYIDASAGGEEKGEPERASAPAVVIKGLKKKFVCYPDGDKEQIRRRNVFVSRRIAFGETRCLPVQDASGLREICEGAGIPEPAAVFGKCPPFGEYSEENLGGYPYIAEKFAERVKGYDFCLVQRWDKENTIYAYIMRREDYLADNFSDVLFLKQYKHE